MQNNVKETSITFTQEQFAEFLNLVKRIPSGPTRTCTFTSCTARYDGTRDESAVESFIATIFFYKCAEEIEDKIALEELPLLLTKDAAKWWTSVRGEVGTWEDAINLLRQAFAPKKPAYEVYTEIFNCKQDASMSTDVFIAKQRILLAELPPPTHLEAVQLDLVFGQLNIRVRERIPRESITSFAELLEKARTVEEFLSKIAESGPVRTKDKKYDGRIRCTYCRRFGHLIEECRTRRGRLQEVKVTGDPMFACFGCGKPGIVRSKCPQCNRRKVKVPHDPTYFC